MVVVVVVVDDDDDDVVLAAAAVVVVVVVVDVVVVGGGGGDGGGVWCWCYPCSVFSRFRSGRESSNRWCFACFCNSRSKKHRKYQCFWRVGSPKPRYLRCFLPLIAKSTVFTLFLGQHLAKTLVFLRRFHHVTKCGFLIRKEQKYCKLQCFESALRVRGRRGGGGY